jgi:hypothetical protein
MYVTLAGVQSTPRVMRGVAQREGVIWDVPLAARGLGDDDEIEMPEECARAGEILLGPGVCGPDPRLKPPVVTIRPGGRLAVAAPAASASSVAAGVSRTTMVLAAAGALGLIYYLGKHK